MLKQRRKKFIKYLDIFFIDLLAISFFYDNHHTAIKKAGKKYYVAFNSEPLFKLVPWSTSWWTRNLDDFPIVHLLC